METKTVKYINVNGKLMDLSHPQVNGNPECEHPILSMPGSRQQNGKKILSTVPPK